MTGIPISRFRSASENCNSTGCSTGVTRPSRNRTSTAVKLRLLRGKVLGGSSSINLMGYQPRSPRRFRSLGTPGGATGWAYADALPYFRRSESGKAARISWRGAFGPAGHTVDASTRSNLRCLAGRGLPGRLARHRRLIMDLTPSALRAVQFTIRNGRRASSSAAYLKPVLHRPGLSLLTGAMVTGVTMRGTHVSGVEFVHQGVYQTCRGGTRGYPLWWGVQFSTTPDAFWNWSRRTSARPWHQAIGRPAGRTQSTRPSDGWTAVAPQGYQPLLQRDAA